MLPSLGSPRVICQASVPSLTALDLSHHLRSSNLLLFCCELSVRCLLQHSPTLDLLHQLASLTCFLILRVLFTIKVSLPPLTAPRPSLPPPCLDHSSLVTRHVICKVSDPPLTAPRPSPPPPYVASPQERAAREPTRNNES